MMSGSRPVGECPLLETVRPRVLVSASLVLKERREEMDKDG